MLTPPEEQRAELGLGVDQRSPAHVEWRNESLGTKSPCRPQDGSVMAADERPPTRGRRALSRCEFRDRRRACPDIAARPSA